MYRHNIKHKFVTSARPPPAPLMSAVMARPTIFSAPHHNPSIPMNQQPLLPFFDATRPPPALPGQQKKCAMKRRLDACEAGPSKIRKAEGSNDDENCKYCIQRELRMDLSRNMEKILNQNMLYEYSQQLQGYEDNKRKLRALVTPELYRFIIEYLEEDPTQENSLVSQIIQPQIELGSSSQESNLVKQFLEYLISDSISPLDSQSYSTSTRSKPSSEQVWLILEMLRNLNPQTAEISPPVSSNIVAHYRNTSTKPLPYQGAGVAGPSNITSSASQVQTLTSPCYPTYHPSIPPPSTRPYYSQSYVFGTNPPTPNMPFNAPVRAATAAGSMTRAPVGPSTSSVTQNYNSYMMGWYPHPPQYYPSFQ